MPKSLRVPTQEAKIQNKFLPILVVTGKRDAISHELIPGCLNLETQRATYTWGGKEFVAKKWKKVKGLILPEG
jgi:hypothetical protein